MKRQKSRSHWIAPLVAVALALAVAAPSLAQSPTGVALSEAVQITAEVVGIDRADRMVTLLGARGNVVDIEVGDEVRNFDQLKVGDKVKVTYYESVALYLGSPGSQPEADAAEVFGHAAKGDKPGAVVVGAIDVSASVRGIDKKKRELTLEMPNGHMVTHKVDPAVRAFDTLRVGDTIHARLTRALAIVVETP